jgi:predicted AAA+ superfamily ATPase
LKEKIAQSLEKRKIVLIYGARQVGKTTLVKEFLGGKSLYLNGDFLDDQDRLKLATRAMVDQFSGLKTLIIDEAQNILDIGAKLKVIHDTLPELRIIATGSSSFELSNKVSEPLTGRNVVYMMFPLAFHEVTGGRFSLNDAMIFGMYPEVFLEKTRSEKRAAIARIAESYLFKDVLNIEYIKNPKSLERLLRVLAAQVGSEVSFNEIANTLDMDVKTVAGYTDILEKLFVVFPLHPLASNVRKSLTKKRKYYFFDLGIRNAALGDFSALDNRDDVGALWENFCIVERMKTNAVYGRMPEYRFFRSYKGEEIDFIEKRDEGVFGFEFKYSKASVEEKIRKIYTRDLAGKGDLEVINKGTFSKFLE